MGILQMMEGRSDTEFGPSRVLSAAGGLVRIELPGPVALGMAVEFGDALGVVLRYDRHGATVAMLSRGPLPMVGESAVLRPALGIRAPAILPGQVEFATVSDLLKIGEKSILDLPPMPPPPRRRPISRRLPCGWAAAEVLMPLGEGHRIGLVGPPATGKSTAAKMLMESQEADTAIVYASQKPLPVVNKTLGTSYSSKGPMVVLYTDAQDPVGARYLLPFCALQVATQLAETHSHVLLVLDDVVAFAGAAAELGGVPISAPQAVAASLDAAGATVDTDGRSRTLSVAAVLDLDPDEELEPIFRNMWRSAEQSLDLRFQFDVTLASKWVLPAIDVDQLLACGTAPVYQAPLLRRLRSELLHKLSSSRELRERLEMGKQLGLHTEPQDQEDLGSARVSRALLAHVAPVALPDLAVVMAASLVFHFPWYTRQPTRAAILGFQEAVVTLIRTSYPQLWETLTLLETIDDEQAAEVIQALGGVLLRHRFDFTLTRPEL